MTLLDLKQAIVEELQTKTTELNASKESLFLILKALVNVDEIG
jgi:hypothetical protein